MVFPFAKFYWRLFICRASLSFIWVPNLVPRSQIIFNSLIFQSVFHICWYMCWNHVRKCQRPSKYDWWRDRDEKQACGCVDPWTKTNIRQDITQLLNVVLNWAEAWLHEHTLQYASNGAPLWMKVSDFIISRRGEKREINLGPVEGLMKIKENWLKIRGQGKDKQRLEWSAANLNAFLTLSMPSFNFEEKTEQSHLKLRVTDTEDEIYTRSLYISAFARYLLVIWLS